MALQIFTKVVENRGFSAAARKLRISTSTVTKSIARLEDELGIQLFNRTTRRLHITDYGQEFYERCARILGELEDAESTVRAGSASPHGRLRVATPFSFGRVTLVPAMQSFLAKYPDITVELEFNDRIVDMIENGYDVGIRTGEFSDSRLVTRLLTRGAEVTFAAPSYLAARGTPSKPEDLRDHNCIVGGFGPEWKFRKRNQEPVTINVRGNLIVNNGDALREAAVAGIGIAQGTWWLVRKDLERGDVRQVLESYAQVGMPISVLYPAQRHLPAKVRVFVDFLVSITQRG